MSAEAGVWRMRLLYALKRSALSLLSHLAVMDGRAATTVAGANSSAALAEQLRQVAASTDALAWSPALVAQQLRAIAAQLDVLPNTSINTTPQAPQPVPSAQSPAAPVHSAEQQAQDVTQADVERLESSYHASPSLDEHQHLSKKQRKGELV